MSLPVFTLRACCVFAITALLVCLWRHNAIREVSCVAFCFVDNGDRIMAISQEGVIKLFNSEEGKWKYESQERSFESIYSHFGIDANIITPRFLDCSPNSNWRLAASITRTAARWNRNSKQSAERLSSTTSGSQCYGAKVNNEGDVVMLSGGKISFFPLGGAHREYELPVSWSLPTSITPDCRYLFISDGGKQCIRVNLLDGIPTIYSEVQDFITCITSTDEHIYLGLIRGSILRYSLNAPSISPVICVEPCFEDILRIEVSPSIPNTLIAELSLKNEQSLLVKVYEKRFIKIIEIPTNVREKNWSLSVNGEKLAAEIGPHKLVVVDLMTGEQSEVEGY